MVVYLLLGGAGLPMFAPMGVPGFARLIGPTGGYLLAYPLAAALVPVLAGNGRSWGRLALGLVAGLVAIHAGGVAQLAILTGDVSAAMALGSAPFLLLDVVKLVIAGLIVRRFAESMRALL
jgi:biotin transport system substrate-specific component